MHGAAQIAKAPPSKKPDPRRRAPWTSPAPSSRFGPREQAHEDEPEDDQDEARDLLEEELVLGNREADRRSAGAEQDEDRDEARDEGQAREDDPAGRARFA